jgi:hypothetical protein
LGNIDMPRTDMGMLEWFEKECSFYPHEGQQEIVTAIEDGKREIDVIAGKRGGKSEIARRIAQYYIAGMAQRTWILGPTWDIVDRIFLPLWDDILKSGTPIIERQKESRRLRTASGGLLEGVSWGSPEQIEAEGVHLVITDESQHLTSKIADRIRARLVGDWHWIRIGSPSEDGMSFYEEEAYATATAALPTHTMVTWPTWLNPDAEVRQAVSIEKESLAYLENVLGADHPAYKQRKRRFDAMYGGMSVPPSDVAIGTFERDIHVRDCPFNPDLPVYLGIDPGYYPSYYAVTVFQPHPWGTALGLENDSERNLEELWQIDEVYVQHTITDNVISMCRERPWWPNVRQAIIDVASRQHDRQTGQSDLMLWQTKTKFPVTAEWVAVNDSLSTHRRWLSQNRLFHDKTLCPNTIKEYLLHKVKARRDGDAKDTEIDRWNHAHKALAYMLVLKYGVHDGSLQPVTWQRETPRPVRRSWRVA